MSSTGSSKEMLAVIRNLKEARVLERSLQTLTLEESYASKLLDLDSKMVKFKFGRLTKDVKKIKSHLLTEDIIRMRQLEKEGRFVPEHPMVCSSSSSTKIAAARRRLKLSQYRRVQSAMPALCSRSRSSISCSSSSEDKSPSGNSNTEVSKDSELPPQCRHKTRPKTTIAYTTSSRVKESDLSDDLSSPRASEQRTKSARNPTSATTLLEKLSKAHNDIKKSVGPVNNYSSHEKTSKEDENKIEMTTGEETVTVPSSTNHYEERRQRLIGAENRSFDSISDKKSTFIQKIEDIKQRNPVQTGVEPEWTERVIKSIDSMAPRSELSLEKVNRHIDMQLIKKVLYTPDKFKREYHTIQLMRKGKSIPETVEDLFVPQRYREEETDDLK